METRNTKLAKNKFPNQSLGYRISPTTGWLNLSLGEVWAYRNLISLFVLRDFKAQYRQMALGPLWGILNPIINMVIFSIVFGKLAQLPSEGIPYPIFSYTALLPWVYFSNVIPIAY